MSGYVTCDRLETALAGKQESLKNCAGEPLSGNAPTCDEMALAIADSATTPPTSTNATMWVNAGFATISSTGSTTTSCDPGTAFTVTDGTGGAARHRLAWSPLSNGLLPSIPAGGTIVQTTFSLRYRFRTTADTVFMPFERVTVVTSSGAAITLAGKMPVFIDIPLVGESVYSTQWETLTATVPGNISRFEFLTLSDASAFTVTEPFSVQVDTVNISWLYA
jgi:hypothetical protein